MKNKFFYIYLVILILSINSCTNSVKLELIGDYEFVGDFTSTINGHRASKNPYFITSTNEQFRNICSDAPLTFSQLLNECVIIDDLTEQDISKLLNEYDLIVSKFHIKALLRNTDFTKQDQCGNLKRSLLK